MATTHVFIVDSITFKYHLEYMFAGTGARDNDIDFNNSATSNLHSTTENNLLRMIADSQRVRVGDFVIFYLQQNFQRGIREGKFYGVFKVKEAPSFLDNNDDEQFLKQQLQRYVDWIEQYDLPNRPSDIEPMIISREITDKTSQSYSNLISEFNSFNSNNNTLPLRYVEFVVNCEHQTIVLNEVNY